MEIYIVQVGDTIYSIAESHGVSITKLIQDNGLVNPYNLAIGQAIIIVYPSQTHIVEEGDSLTNIANTYGVTIMQLLRNNYFLSEREYLYQGETLVISYNTINKLSINGYAYSFIDIGILRKTLPYLTYLTILNYTIADEAKITKVDDAEIIIHIDDSEIIKMAKDYGVKPLMMISSLSFQGEANIELDYAILLDKEYQNKLITNFINILRVSGYSGINLLVNNLRKINQNFHYDLFSEISHILKNEGYLFFLTIKPYLDTSEDKASFEEIDYSVFSKLADNIVILEYLWGKYTGPPAPVSSINLLSDLIDYIVAMTPPEKISVGKPLIAYDWILPYDDKNSYAISLNLITATSLAYDMGAIIQFDETSQTPYFHYQTSLGNEIVDHIVWFVDVRTLNSLYKLTIEKSLEGCGVWNVMVFYPQIWTLSISQYEIVKLLPEF